MLAAGDRRQVENALTIAHPDGRERIAVPFWNGVLSAIGANVVGFVALAIAGAAFLYGAVLVAGHVPSTAPGELYDDLVELAFYGAAGWFAWWRLRASGVRPLRRPTRRDFGVLLLGIAAMVVVRILAATQLALTHQENHVQAGFEHFSVAAGTTPLTALTAALALIALVVVAPLVEELIFRGLLFGALVPRLGVFAAALVSAVLFGAVHGDPVLFPELAALGFVAALCYAASGNLLVAVVLHALSNALGAAFLVSGSLSGG